MAPNGRGEGVQETEILKVIRSVKLGAVGTTGTLTASSVFSVSGYSHFKHMQHFSCVEMHAYRIKNTKKRDVASGSAAELAQLLHLAQNTWAGKIGQTVKKKRSVLKHIFFLNIWEQKKEKRRTARRYLYELLPGPEPTDCDYPGQVGKQEPARQLSARSLWKGGLGQKDNALRRHSAWQMSVIYWLCTCICVCVCMSVQMLNNVRLPGRWFLGSDCIPVRERHKTRIRGVFAALNDSCDLFSRPDIQMYTCTHLHTPTRSVLICLNTHGSDARARSGSGRLPKAAIISRQILFKECQFIQTLAAKVVHKRPCETCVGTHARWFTPAPRPPDAL